MKALVVKCGHHCLGFSGLFCFAFYRTATSPRLCCRTRVFEHRSVRSVDSPYKCGRSTNKEGYLLKLKRFSDSEAEIIGFEELEHNNNIAKKDAFGRSERSSCKENMVGGNTLGTLLVKDIKSAVEFRIGSGLDMAMREKIWNNKSDYLNKIVKYKFFSVGVKELPRHPVLLGFRHIDDMD